MKIGCCEVEHHVLSVVFTHFLLYLPPCDQTLPRTMLLAVEDEPKLNLLLYK